MTVAEIKKYISEKLNNKPILEIKNYGENEPQKLFTPIEHYCDTLVEIRSMLDELEPKAKWEIDGHHRRCKKCGEYFCIDDREGDEIPHNFCGNCGARMESE